MQSGVKVANSAKLAWIMNFITQDKPEGKAEVQKELEEGLEVLIQNNIDLILVEVFTSFHHSKMKD